MREAREVMEPVNTGSVPMPGDPRLAFYVDAIRLLETNDVPLPGGRGLRAFEVHRARSRHQGSGHHASDARTSPRALAAFKGAGYDVEIPFPHWLGKVRREHQYIDVVFSSGNGLVSVDDLWFAHAVGAEVLGISVALCPAEELLWSSAFVQERERYDGAAVLHLLHARGLFMDWPRLIERFGRHWPVLFSYLILFEFAYPDRRGDIPDDVMDELTERLRNQQPEPDNRMCLGTLLSRAAVSVRPRPARLH